MFKDQPLLATEFVHANMLHTDCDHKHIKYTTQIQYFMHIMYTHTHTRTRTHTHTHTTHTTHTCTHTHTTHTQHTHVHTHNTHTHNTNVHYTHTHIHMIQLLDSFFALLCRYKHSYTSYRFCSVNKY